MKKLRIRWALKIFSIFDILLSERFELKSYKNNELISTTNYCKKEINNLYK